MEQLREKGYAVIPLLNDEECEQMYGGIWDFFERITSEWPQPLNRNNQATWRGFYSLLPLHSMLVQHYQVGQAQVSWDLRQNPKLIKVFQDLWGTQELQVSFDGMSLHLPPEVTKRGWRGKLWMHRDQSFYNNEFRCIQGFVTARDINEGDATLCLLEGSHLLSIPADKIGPQHKGDWCKLTESEMEYYKDCKRVEIVCPKGSLVLWDSRTIHCGIEAAKSRAAPNIRAIIYVCYMPKRLSTAANNRKRVKAFQEMRTTAHNPSKCKLFQINPRTYGASLPQTKALPAPILNEIGRSLI